ncbi:hypothetical protein FB451DRAFT_1501251 [Mycena latifolia]|nr:hypothetical protein FB451DRAFT_1501251 [Mycena latifolia]
MSWISGTSLSFLASAPPASTVTKILLGALICAAAAYALYCHASPIRLTRALVAAIAATEKTYLEAIEAGAISSSDVHTATTLTSLQLKVSNIREATLRNSLYHRAALGTFLEGRTLIILQGSPARLRPNVRKHHAHGLRSTAP